MASFMSSAFFRIRSLRCFTEWLTCSIGGGHATRGRGKRLRFLLEGQCAERAPGLPAPLSALWGGSEGQDPAQVLSGSIPAAPAFPVSVRRLFGRRAGIITIFANRDRGAAKLPHLDPCLKQLELILILLAGLSPEVRSTPSTSSNCGNGFWPGRLSCSLVETTKRDALGHDDRPRHGKLSKYPHVRSSSRALAGCPRRRPALDRRSRPMSTIAGAAFVVGSCR